MATIKDATSFELATPAGAVRFTAFDGGKAISWDAEESPLEAEAGLALEFRRTLLQLMVTPAAVSVNLGEGVFIRRLPE